jgi:hypothetical protein
MLRFAYDVTMPDGRRGTFRIVANDTAEAVESIRKLTNAGMRIHGPARNRGQELHNSPREYPTHSAHIRR